MNAFLDVLAYGNSAIAATALTGTAYRLVLICLLYHWHGRLEVARMMNRRHGIRRPAGDLASYLYSVLGTTTFLRFLSPPPPPPPLVIKRLKWIFLNEEKSNPTCNVTVGRLY